MKLVTLYPVWTEPGGQVFTAWYENDVLKHPLMRMVYDAPLNDEAI